MLFSWWKSQTLGTWLQTKLSGNAVGTDDFGNRYFQNKDGSRRWVIYNGTVEASRVPPDWHGWMHHTYAEPPTRALSAPPHRPSSGRATALAHGGREPDERRKTVATERRAGPGTHGAAPRQEHVEHAVIVASKSRRDRVNSVSDLAREDRVGLCE